MVDGSSEIYQLKNEVKLPEMYTRMTQLKNDNKDINYMCFETIEGHVWVALIKITSMNFTRE